MQGKAFGEVFDHVFIHFDIMLAATITLIFQLFVGTLKEKWEFIQSDTVGLG